LARAAVEGEGNDDKIPDLNRGDLVAESFDDP